MGNAEESGVCGIIAIVIGGASGLGPPSDQVPREGPREGPIHDRTDGGRPHAARAVHAARRAMLHRGPDGEGMHEMLGGHAVLGHRRLAVVDPTSSGAQPMRSARGAIVYNGELYNDAEVRRQLLTGPTGGDVFATRCDTETVLRAIDTWYAGGLDALRGMYGLVHVNATTGRVLIARDPMGVKPLYWWRGATRLDGEGRGVVVVASEINAVITAAREFGYTPAPDWGVVSAYLTTIRTTLGERTMFDGIRIVEAGAWIELDSASRDLREARGWHGWFKPGNRGATPIERASHLRAGGARDCIAVLDASVRAHMRSDVALCSLLSGGVDSTLIAALAARALREDKAPTLLRTFCAGARASGQEDDDFAWARRVAIAIGSIHSEVQVTREGFVDRWRKTIESSGVVMSTPNQVAIQEVARAIRASGHVVALSGEGADELLGGYDLALRGPIEGELGGAEWTRDARARAAHMIGTAAWVPMGVKNQVLNDGLVEAIEEDSALIEAYSREWEMWSQPWLDGDGYARDRATRAHLRFLARINMQGLLTRLDESTMRFSVEGRTPFADVRVARWASGLGAAETIDAEVSGVAGTKRVLREAMMLATPEGAGGVGDVFEGVRDRAKASFPLPFQEWMVDAREVLRSGASREVFSPAAIELVHADPSRAWALAWPMMNVAMWLERWWGAAGAEVKSEQSMESGERAAARA